MPRPYDPTVTVVIPARNEAPNLPHVLAALPAGARGHPGRRQLGRHRRGGPRVLPGHRRGPQTRKGKGNALACGFARRDRRHHRDARRRRLDRPGGDPGLRRRAARGCRLRQGHPLRRRRRQRDITALRKLGNWSSTSSRTCCSAPATPTSATATTPSGATAAGARPARPAPERTGRKLWGDGFEIETLINFRVAAAGPKIARCRSFERRGCTARATCAPSDGSRAAHHLQRVRPPVDSQVGGHSGASPARARFACEVASADRLEVRQRASPRPGRRSSALMDVLPTSPADTSRGGIGVPSGGMLAVELTAPLPAITVDRVQSAPGMLLSVLVRMHGHPLGQLELSAPAGLTAAELASAIWAGVPAVRDRSARRRARRPSGSRPGRHPAGQRHGPALPCSAS